MRDEAMSIGAVNCAISWSPTETPTLFATSSSTVCLACVATASVTCGSMSLSSTVTVCGLVAPNDSMAATAASAASVGSAPLPLAAGVTSTSPLSSLTVSSALTGLTLLVPRCSSSTVGSACATSMEGATSFLSQNA